MKSNLREERKQQRMENNKRYILDAAETVFSQKGFGSATMDDIAEEAQFSKATVYRYFNSKNEIFYDIVMNSFSEAHENILRIRNRKVNAEERIRDLILYILTYFLHKKNISRIFVMERSAMKRVMKFDIDHHVLAVEGKKGIPSQYLDIMNEIFDAITGIIQDGIDSGEFRRVNAREAGFVLGALLRGFHFKGPLREMEYSLEDSTKLVHGFFLNGIKNPAGKQQGDG